MIVTVTPNPSIDRTLALHTLRRGDVQRAHGARAEPSGKGVNVAVAVRRAGREVVAVLPLAGPSGRFLSAMLDEIGLPHVTVPASGSVRVNTTLVEDDGTTSKINEIGPRMTIAEVSALVTAAGSRGRPGDWIAWCGSLPLGFSPATLADAVAACRRAGLRVAVDTSEEALADVLGRRPEELPHVIKPNADELAALVGHSLDRLEQVVDAARAIVARGVETVLVSMGSAGAILVERDLVLHGRSPVDRVVNTAGAGDAFLAGYLCRSDGPPTERLTWALGFAAAAVQESGTLLTQSPPPQPATAIRLF